MRKHILATLAVSCALTAQAYYIPSDTPATGTCNSIPFGDTNGSALWTNQVYQSIATAAELGNTPGYVTGLAFAPCGTGVHKNTRLRISLSHVPPGHTLRTTFALNQPSPRVVLDIANHSWHLTANQWNDIGLQTAFVYDGVSDLVMEIIAEGNICPPTDQFHRDVGPRVSANNWTGTPPLTGTTSYGALKWCISRCVASVSLYGDSCGGLSHSYTGVPRLGGSTLDAIISGCAPNSGTILIIGNTIDPPYPLDLSYFGCSGCNEYTNGVVVLHGVADGAGVTTFPLAFLLNIWSLNCGILYTQAGNGNPGVPCGLSASNYARLLFGS